jgi:hypothetical protein
MGISSLCNGNQAKKQQSVGGLAEQTFCRSRRHFPYSNGPQSWFQPSSSNYPAKIQEHQAVPVAKLRLLAFSQEMKPESKVARRRCK